MPDETLFFMHIPKTAGTSLHRILELNFKPWKTYSLTYPAVESQRFFTSLPRERRNSFQLVKGHFPYGFHEHVDTKPVYVSFVRNPIARVLSDYNYRCREKFLPGYEEFRRTQFSFEHYLAHLYMPNLSTLFFAGVGHLRKADEPMDVLFKRAVANLDHFRFVGLVEQFQQSLDGLARTIALKQVADLRLNATDAPRMADLTPDQKRFIRASERWDLALYERVLVRHVHHSRHANRIAARRISPMFARFQHLRHKPARTLHMRYLKFRYRSHERQAEAGGAIGCTDQSVRSDQGNPCTAPRR